MTNTRTLSRYFMASYLTLAMVACVPANKFEAEQSKRQAAEKELADTKASAKTCETALTEEKQKTAQITKQINGLEKDTNIIGSNYRNLTSKYDKLEQINEQLLAQLSKLTQNQNNENNKLMGQLQMSQSSGQSLTVWSMDFWWKKGRKDLAHRRCTENIRFVRRLRPNLFFRIARSRRKISFRRPRA